MGLSIDLSKFKKYTVFLTIFPNKIVNIVTYFLNVDKSNSYFG
jgi:hypothetical protein